MEFYGNSHVPNKVLRISILNSGASTSTFKRLLKSKPYARVSGVSDDVESAARRACTKYPGKNSTREGVVSSE